MYTSLPLVDYFEVPVLEKVAHLALPGENGGDQLSLNLLLLLELISLVPFLEPHLPLTTEQQHVLDLRGACLNHRIRGYW